MFARKKHMPSVRFATLTFTPDIIRSDHRCNSVRANDSKSQEHINIHMSNIPFNRESSLFQNLNDKPAMRVRPV